jgi:hypothetical protein
MELKKIPVLLAATGIMLGAGVISAQEAIAQGVTQVNRQMQTDWGARPQRQGKQKKMALMPGNVAKENIQKVTSEIRWNSNLNSALAQAHRQNKMVLWVHLVGNLSGAT